MYKIVVNDVEMQVSTETLLYADIATLTQENYPDTPTVMYRSAGQSIEQQKQLTKTQDVQVAEGMVFDVSYTGEPSK